MLECPFYYDCVVKRTQSVKIVEEFLFLECMISPEGVADRKRIAKAMKSVATEFSMTDISSLVLMTMRAHVRSERYRHVRSYREFSEPSIIMGAECFAQPLTVPDSPEHLRWMDWVWGN